MRVLFGSPATPVALRCAIVALSGAEARQAAKELLASCAVEAIFLDVGSEDSFLDVDELLEGVEGTGADVVINLAPRSATPVALSVLRDLPLVTTTKLDVGSVKRIDDALRTGSEIHRFVLDVRTGNRRRLCPGGLELHAPSAIWPLLDDVPSSGPVARSHSLHIEADQPASGQLTVETAGGTRVRARTLEVSDAPAGTSLVVASRAQEVRDVAVCLHPCPVRELLLGASSAPMPSRRC